MSDGNADLRRLASAVTRAPVQDLLLASPFSPLNNYSNTLSSTEFFRSLYVDSESAATARQQLTREVRQHVPLAVISGSRGCGKTTFLEHCFLEIPHLTTDFVTAMSPGGIQAAQALHVTLLEALTSRHRRLLSSQLVALLTVMATHGVPHRVPSGWARLAEVLGDSNSGSSEIYEAIRSLDLTASLLLMRITAAILVGEVSHLNEAEYPIILENADALMGNERQALQDAILGSFEISADLALSEAFERIMLLASQRTVILEIRNSSWSRTIDAAHEDRYLDRIPTIDLSGAFGIRDILKKRIHYYGLLGGDSPDLHSLLRIADYPVNWPQITALYNSNIRHVALALAREAPERSASLDHETRYALTDEPFLVRLCGLSWGQLQAYFDDRLLHVVGLPPRMVSENLSHLILVYLSNQVLHSSSPRDGTGPPKQDDVPLVVILRALQGVATSDQVAEVIWSLYQGPDGQGGSPLVTLTSDGFSACHRDELFQAAKNTGMSATLRVGLTPMGTVLIRTVMSSFEYMSMLSSPPASVMSLPDLALRPDEGNVTIAQVCTAVVRNLQLHAEASSRYYETVFCRDLGYSDTSFLASQLSFQVHGSSIPEGRFYYERVALRHLRYLDRTRMWSLATLEDRAIAEELLDAFEAYLPLFSFGQAIERHSESTRMFLPRLRLRVDECRKGVHVESPLILPSPLPGDSNIPQELMWTPS